MAKSANASGHPVLKIAGLKLCATRLDEDLGKVLASAASDSDKEQAKVLVKDIKTMFGLATADNVGDWVVLLVPRFQGLTNIIKLALNLPPAEIGACLYSTSAGDRCIQCTRAQCIDLGGTFQSDTPCP